MLLQLLKSVKHLPKVSGCGRTFQNPHSSAEIMNIPQNRKGGHSGKRQLSKTGATLKNEENARKFKRCKTEESLKNVPLEGPSKRQEPCALDDNELQKRFHVRQENLRRKNLSSTTQVFRMLCDSFEKSRNPEKATAMSKYLRSQFEFFGIQSPQRREISKPVSRFCIEPSCDNKEKVIFQFCSDPV